MKRTLTTEHLLYLLALLIALSLRFYRLGLPALNESEASWALQSLAIARSGATQVGAQPAYVLLTSLLFWLVGSTNFLARCLPALVGSLLVVLPYLFRPIYEDSEWLRKAGLVMAFGLALDPGLVSLSRQAGSPILALAFALFTLGMLVNRQWVWAGILGGLALLSGPALVAGLLVFVITWTVYQLLLKTGWLEKGQVTWIEAPESSAAWRPGLFALGVTVLVAGVWFLRLPQGLAALAQTIPDYLNGWLHAGDVPALRLPAALLIYQPLALVFGLAAAARGWAAARSGLRGAHLAQLLSLWALVALLLSMAYPARQVGDLVWTLVPLWALAALEISRFLPAHEDLKTRLVALGLSVLILLLIIISWNNLLTLVRMNSSAVVFWVAFGGALLMAVIATLLVGMSWSAPAARMGLAWGLLLGLGLGVFSSVIGVSLVRPSSIRELWSTSPAAGQVTELLATLRSLSDWESGLGDQIEVVVTADTSELRWALRNDPYVTFASSPDAVESPAVVITWKDQETPTLAQAYRGQDLVLQWYPGWQGALPSPFLPWLAYRQAPLAQLQAVLWARADVFPGGMLDLLQPFLDQQPSMAPVEQVQP